MQAGKVSLLKLTSVLPWVCTLQCALLTLWAPLGLSLTQPCVRQCLELPCGLEAAARWFCRLLRSHRTCGRGWGLLSGKRKAEVWQPAAGS